MKCNFDLIDEQYFVCLGCQAKFFKLPWLLRKTAVCLYPALFQIHKPQRVFVPNFMLVLHFEAILPFYSLRKSTSIQLRLTCQPCSISPPERLRSNGMTFHTQWIFLGEIRFKQGYKHEICYKYSTCYTNKISSRIHKDRMVAQQQLLSE